MNVFKKRMTHILRSFLRSELVCYIVFKIRFIFYVYFKRKISVFENDKNVYANPYSIKMLKKGKTSNRPLRLIRPLSVIEAVNKKGNILSIGCRFETELLYLVGYGFEPKKIKGFDMISYSPWIETGNMHKMRFEDSTWDTLILGWVLPYSMDQKVVADEVVRVTQNGGVVAIGLTAYSKEQIKKIQETGEVVPLDTRKQKTQEVLDLFGGHIDQVYYRHDQVSDAVEGTCAVIFSIKK
jgi:hypothetical protein